MNLSLFMAAASGLVIGNSLFFGTYIWNFDSKGRISNRLLALLLFALAIRISKSVIIILIPDSPDFLPAIGLTGMAAIGPFLYLYLRSIHEDSFSFGGKEGLHLIPAIVLAVMLPQPFVDELVIYRFYQFVVAQIFAYIVLGFLLHRSSSVDHRADAVKTRWGYILLSGSALIWVAFFAQLIADTFLLYLVATTIAAFVLYGVSFWVMKNRLDFRENGRLSRVNGDTDVISEKIRAAFETEKLYLDPEMTIDKLADAIKSQSYLVSLVVNEKFGRTFPELLNSYRIEEAKQKLTSTEYRHLSVEAVAYDCGFNSISSFYSSFKKICNTTPAEYRKRYQE